MTAQPQTWDQAVLANEGLFQGILEAAPDAVVIVDRDGVIRIVNGQTEKLLGYSREELLGSSVDRLVPEAVQEAHAAHRERYLADARTWPMGLGLDLRARRKDGTEIPVEISLSPLKLDDGRPLVIAIVRDITDRHEWEEALARRSAELEETARPIHQPAVFFVNPNFAALAGSLKTLAGPLFSLSPPKMAVSRPRS